MAAEAHDDAASLRERPVQEPGVSGPEAPVRNRKRRDALRDRSRQKHGRRGISEAEDIGARSPACRALRTRAMASAKKKPGKPGFFHDRRRYSSGLMLIACGPLGPLALSNDTFWFSFRLLKPLPWIAEKCAKRSFPPSSGVMNPKPLESLNHFTVPVLM